MQGILVFVVLAVLVVVIPRIIAGAQRPHHDCAWQVGAEHSHQTNSRSLVTPAFPAR